MVTSAEPAANVIAKVDDVHASKALAPILITLLGIATAPRLEHDLKVSAPMVVIGLVGGIVNVAREVAPSKALTPIPVTETGSANAVRPDDLKAASPMVRRPLVPVKVNEARAVAPSKALAPIVWTVSGSAIVVRAVASRKASLPIVVNPLFALNVIVVREEPLKP